MVQENQDFIVIKDINPKAPIHFLLVPRKHIESMTELNEVDRSWLGAMLYETKMLAAKHGLSERGLPTI